MHILKLKIIKNMECKEVKNYMEKFLSDDFPGSIRKKIKDHLLFCQDCRKEFNHFEKLLGAFDYLPDNQPNKKSVSEFHQMLEAEKEKISDNSLNKSKRISIRYIIPIGIAASVILFIIGFVSGKQVTTVQIQNQQMHVMLEEIRETRNLLMLSMLEQQSASKRIMGVNYTQQMEILEPRIFNALFNTLNRDKSDNVRLAALEVLSGFSYDLTVRNELIKSLEKQSDPIIQINFITLMVNLNEKKSVEQLKKIIDNENTIEEVKEYAKKGLTILL